MLNKDIISASELLKGLSEEQINAIVSLSENDEKAVFGQRFSEIHNELDAAVKEASGIEKAGSEKTSAYIKRVIETNKAVVDDIRKENVTLTEKIKDLEGKVALGSGDRELLDTQRATIADLQTKYNELKTEKERAEAAFEQRMLDYRINSAIEGALGGVKLKDGVNDEAANALKALAVNAVKGMKPSFVKDGDEEVLVFHDEAGAELRNKENGLNLFTAEELLKAELAKYGIVSEGRKAAGNGGTGSQGNGGTSGILAGATTQSAAYDAIKSYLASRGIATTDANYQTEFDKIWSESKAGELAEN